MAWPGSARIRSTRGLRRNLWVGFSPNGMGQQKPHHYRDMARVVWRHRRNLPYAWRILRKGVCDGCALGVAGFHDWTLEGVHLCTTRLELLELNTARALDPKVLADVSKLADLDGAGLRALGRLPYPMLRRRGEPGFTRVSWDEAIELAAGRIRSAPTRTALYLTARGITNEVYYVAQKFIRFLGTNHVDNAARVCHAPSTVALKDSLGVGATTCSYTDVIGSDLIVLFGSNVANAQPVFMKYLYLARRRGAKVIVVNPYREPGLERYWVPSNLESAAFGTQIADEFFQVDTGGDAAFIAGVLKELLARGAVDRRFIRECTDGFDQLLRDLESLAYEDLERWSGTTRAEMARFAEIYGAADTAVLVWSMGITQHRHGVDNVHAIVDLALARGNVGRPGCGVMPIRGHSGVQGGAEMGAYSTALPGGLAITADSAAALAAQYGFPISSTPGMRAESMVLGAQRGQVEVLYSSGGNFLDVLPDPDLSRHSLARVPLRIHQDIVVTSQMLVEPGEEVLLLPACTRYEQPGGGTETTTERRIVFSPEVRGPRVGEARAEWEIFRDLAQAVDPERAHLIAFDDAQAVRDEIARVVPLYAGIETLAQLGDSVQWGGARIGEDGAFPTADGLAHFSVFEASRLEAPEGSFLLSTRRGKQFNSMVFREVDPLTGAGRHDVFMAESDLAGLGIADGAPVRVRSRHGELAGRARAAAIRAGNVQVFFPEGNVLVAADDGCEVSGMPAYTEVVEIHPG